MKRVLVVEDDPDIVELIHHYLKAEGFEVESLADGRRALERLRAASFGLLILATPRPHVWTAQERKLASYVASVAAVALQTSRLLNRLSETDGRLRNLIEDIPAVVYMSEVEFPYRTFHVGPQAESILGYTVREWLDDPELFAKLVHPDDIQGLVDLAEEAKRGSGLVQAEYRMLDRAGNTRWFRDEAVLVRDPAGKALAWNGILVEVTSIKSMEASQQGASRQAPDLPPSPDRTTPPRPPHD